MDVELGDYAPGWRLQEPVGCRLRQVLGQVQPELMAQAQGYKIARVVRRNGFRDRQPVSLIGLIIM